MTQLILKKNGEFHSYHKQGSAILVDGVFISPAINGWSNGVFSLELAPSPEPDAPTAPTKQQLLDYSAECRWNKQQGPVSIGGVLVKTDLESRNLINGAKGLAEIDPDLITPFKAVSGRVLLTSPQVIALAEQVGRFVLACFALEAEVADKIEDGLITDYAQIEAEYA